MAEEKNKEVVKATSAALAGGAVGFAAHTSIGGVGIAALGTAISLPAAAFVGAGAVVGMAGYGLYRLIKK